MVEPRGLEACLNADLAEARAAVLVRAHVQVEEVANTGVVVGKAGSGAGDREVDVGIARDEEIGTAVAVEVCDCRAGMPPVAPDPGSPRALGKCAVAVVPQQLVLPVDSDEEVGVAVPVQVRGDAALATDREPCS